MNANEQIEEQLIVMQAQLGDDSAFERLIQRYHSRLTYYIRRLVGDPEKSQDVLQAGWLNAYRKLRQLRSTEAFRVWLYRIAHNQSMKAILEDQRFVQVDEQSSQAVEDEQSIELQVLDTLAIHNALDQLNPVHKEVLTLRFLEDLSYQEIADVVGCEIGTVRSRLYHAKLKMKELLEVQDE